MTTKVTVDPANHKILVIEKYENNPVNNLIELDKLSRPRDFWIWGDKSITIMEMNDEV